MRHFYLGGIKGEVLGRILHVLLAFSRCRWPWIIPQSASDLYSLAIAKMSKELSFSCHA